MDDKSTTPGNNSQDADAAADSTTGANSATGTDNQPANGDNLNDSSKSDDTNAAADGDNTSTGDNADSDDKSGDDKGDGADDAPASQLDDDLDDWIDKRGLPKPETDEQKLAYQDQRNQQREFTRERQARKDAEDLKKGIDAENPSTDDEDDDDLDPLEKRQNKVEAELAAERTTRQQSEFYTSNKVTPDEHKAILDIFKEKVARPSSDTAKKAAFDYWSSTDALPDLLDLARARVNTVDTNAVRDEAARKEREKIARESNASGPGRSATHTQTGDKTPEEQRHDALLERYSKPRS